MTTAAGNLELSLSVSYGSVIILTPKGAAKSRQHIGSGSGELLITRISSGRTHTLGAVQLSLL